MPTEYRKGAHTIFNIQVHLTWITKYRYKVLKGEIGQRTKILTRQICVENGVEIISGAVVSDHVHLLISIDPSIAISTLVKYLKGKSSRKLQMEFPELKKRYWGQHLWARRYFAVSTGNVTTEVIRQYPEHHLEGKEGPDSFRVEEP